MYLLKMKNTFYLLLVAIIFSSCGNENSDNVFKNDFDQLANWGYQSPMLKSGGAHSGVYYCGLDSTNDYSLTFQRYIKDIPVKNLKTVNASAWVRTKTIDTKATLIVTIDSIGGAVKYMGIPFINFVTAPEQWTEIKGTLEVPANVNPENFLKVYVNNVGKESADIDDVKIEVE
jgi:hypothetical protein